MRIGGCHCLNGINNFSIGDVPIGDAMLPDGTTTVQLSGKPGGKGWYEVWLRGVRIGTLKPGGRNGIYVADGAPIPPEPRAIEQTATPVQVAAPAPALLPNPQTTQSTLQTIKLSQNHMIQPLPSLPYSVPAVGQNPVTAIQSDYSIQSVPGGATSNLQPLVDDPAIVTTAEPPTPSETPWGLLLALGTAALTLMN